MSKLIPLATVLCVWATAALATPQADSNEAWVGKDYDTLWNAQRSGLLSHWRRQSFAPEASENCLSVGQVWYCPTEQASADK